MPSVVFVINRALVRDPRGFGRRCRAAARNFGWEPVLAETSPGESGLGLARQAVADGAVPACPRKIKTAAIIDCVQMATCGVL